MKTLESQTSRTILISGPGSSSPSSDSTRIPKHVFGVLGLNVGVIFGLIILNMQHVLFLFYYIFKQNELYIWNGLSLQRWDSNPYLLLCEPSYLSNRQLNPEFSLQIQFQIRISVIDGNVFWLKVPWERIKTHNFRPINQSDLKKNVFSDFGIF